MCLVSYTPFRDGFLLNSNRDESPTRAAKSFTNQKIGDHTILFPEDVMGGSWICMSSRGEVYCVLNGAFQQHKRKLPYKMSRGQMLRRSFSFDDSVDFIENFDFSGIEPFTMILKSHKFLFEFRWDGHQRHIQKLMPDQVHIWSSCTLYTTEIQQKRKQWFIEDFKYQEASPESLREIHINGGKEDPFNGFVMNRHNLVKTISFTQVFTKADHIHMYHEDLSSGEIIKAELTIQNIVPSG